MIMRWLTTSSCIPTSAGVAPYNSYNWRVAAYLATISISIHLHYWLSRKSFTLRAVLDFALFIKSSPGHAPCLVKLNLRKSVSYNSEKYIVSIRR